MLALTLGALACEPTVEHYGYYDRDHFDHNVITTKTNTMGTSTAPTARAGSKSPRRFAPFFLKKTTDHKNVDSRRPLTENVVSSLDLESRFYAVLSKAA